jgi:hypothetical protein
LFSGINCSRHASTQYRSALLSPANLTRTCHNIGAPEGNYDCWLACVYWTKGQLAIKPPPVEGSSEISNREKPEVLDGAIWSRILKLPTKAARQRPFGKFKAL